MAVEKRVAVGVRGTIAPRLHVENETWATKRHVRDGLMRVDHENGSAPIKRDDAGAVHVNEDAGWVQSLQKETEGESQRSSDAWAMLLMKVQAEEMAWVNAEYRRSWS